MSQTEPITMSSIPVVPAGALRADPPRPFVPPAGPLRRSVAAGRGRSVGRLRAWLIVRGVAGLILGGLILFLPGLTIDAFALVVGVFLVVVGVIRIVVGAADSEFTAGLRVANIVLGVVLAAIGAVAIRFPGFGLVATVLLIGFAWMMEGGAALALAPPRGRGRGWVVAFAIVSLLAGAALILWPVEAIAPLVIVAGAALVVGGLFDFVGGFTLHSARTALPRR
ncbi:MAG: DUF308 domain-containing protein [Bifidobacteriaceae bacterium]|jgi:uncharacterized membrane protein HdeD (DUF308 family)|nr:DUF308 domain-containing protein [Bifidobacteriaceae bacterium]